MHAFVKRVFRRAAAPARRGSATRPGARPTLEALEDRQLLTVPGITSISHVASSPLVSELIAALPCGDRRILTAIDPRVQFVNNLYADLLNRQPDTAGAQGWERILVCGDNSTADSRRALRLQVANGFLHGDEYIRKFVGNLYSQEVGGTDPNFTADVAGLEGGTLTTRDFRANVLAGDAYFTSHGGTIDSQGVARNFTAWVDSVFVDLVGRHFDATRPLDGRVSNALNHDLFRGISPVTARTWAVQQVQADLEAKTHRVQLLYKQFLNQPLTTPLDAAGQQLAQDLYVNKSECDVMAQILVSDAYYAKGTWQVPTIQLH
jgi:hypothetical protein